MKTTTMRTLGAICSAGILLTSCVSSKKYHRSQDEVARLRTDSTTLAQKGTALQQSLDAAQQKSTDLQKSLEAANTTSAGLQRNVAYYHDYADKQAASTTQIKNDLSSTLAAAGLSDQDIMQMNGKIYINIGEKSLFKGGSAMLTSKGKQLVNDLGQYVKNHDAVDLSVADLQQATSVSENGEPVTTTTTTVTMPGRAKEPTAMTNEDKNQPATARKWTEKTDKTYAKSRKNASGNADNNASSSASKPEETGTAAPHKRSVAVHHARKASTAPAGENKSGETKSGENKSMAYSSGHRRSSYTTERNNRSMAHATAWKRQNAVADELLRTGVPKVKLVSQLNTGNSGAQKGVQVVLVNDMDNFYKHMSQPPAGQPVSMNP